MPEPEPDKGDPDDAPKPDTDPDLSNEVEKWKAQSRKHEAQAKANAEAAKKLAAMEDADKTEQQKLNDRTAAAEKRAQDAEMRALRLEVANEKGLTAKQASRLVGESKEELEADADELLADFTPASNADGEPERGGPATRPKANLRGGGDPTEEPDETDPRKLAARVIGRGY